jgi:zinc and cadmium transporter
LNPAFLFALVTAAAVVAGGLLITTASPRSRRAQRILIGFGAGYMLALAILAMVPHAVMDTGGSLLGVLIGYLLVHLTQHVLTPHFHFGEETHGEAMVGRWVGISALLGLLLHTFFDGVAIASGFHVSAALGVLVFTGIVLHKIPEGITAASVMLASGNSNRSAIVGVLLLGVATVAGVLLTEYIEPLQRYGLALSAGVTLYVAASNLVPEVQQDREWGPAVALLLGAGLFIAARLLLAELHL